MLKLIGVLCTTLSFAVIYGILRCNVPIETVYTCMSFLTAGYMALGTITCKLVGLIIAAANVVGIFRFQIPFERVCICVSIMIIGYMAGGKE